MMGIFLITSYVSRENSRFCQMFVGTTQKMKISIKDFFSKCDQTLNGKLNFLCSVVSYNTTLPSLYFQLKLIYLMIRNLERGALRRLLDMLLEEQLIPYIT